MAEQKQIQKKFFLLCLRKPQRKIYSLLFRAYAYVAGHNQAYGSKTLTYRIHCFINTQACRTNDIDTIEYATFRYDAVEVESPFST